MKNRMSHTKKEKKNGEKQQEFRWAALDGNGDDGRHLKNCVFMVPFITQNEKKTHTNCKASRPIFKKIYIN